MKSALSGITISGQLTLLLLLALPLKSFSNNLPNKTFTGVVSVYQSESTLAKPETDRYFLHINKNITPLHLIFNNGHPEHPIMTGDKIRVVGMNTSGRLYVTNLKHLRMELLPF